MYIRKAMESELPSIRQAIYEAALKIQSKNIKQWERYTEWTQTAIVLEDYQRKELYVCERNNEIIGSFVLTYGSSFDFNLWEETEHHEIRYLHRLVIFPKFTSQNFGKQLLEMIVAHCLHANIQLRLDCVSTNTFLVQFYRTYFQFSHEKSGYTCFFLNS